MPDHPLDGRGAALTEGLYSPEELVWLPEADVLLCERQLGTSSPTSAGFTGTGGRSPDLTFAPTP